ncbi:hypothetical protein BPS26883_06363 [Burkholderia pseudomultivorans]|uniref:Uncharacterized protein n=1 Tax=Burkholderia pseudomultivorans TaxID=1207504 RepID=A0A6P2R1K0_9BURK|nr:hypothetical protein BPS26883_06363 [Burkholderia pseudomultivorans]
MDVAAPAHGRRVVQHVGHRAHGLDDLLARFRDTAVRRAAQQRERLHAAGPGPVVLRGEFRAGDLAQIVVHVRRADRVAFAVVVDVLEQFVPRQLGAAPHDSRDARIVDRHVVLDAALADEAQPHLPRFDLQMPLAQRRQPVRLVLARVFRVADARERRVEQPDDRRDDLLARHAGPREVARDAGADTRQRERERGHSRILVRVARRSPLRVIAVLLAPARVAAGRLQMAARVRADPDVGVRGRNRERVDSRDLVRIADPLAVLRVIREAVAHATTRVARLPVVDVTQRGGRARVGHAHAVAGRGAGRARLHAATHGDLRKSAATIVSVSSGVRGDRICAAPRGVRRSVEQDACAVRAAPRAASRRI